jgi:hypothetical protein
MTFDETSPSENKAPFQPACRKTAACIVALEREYRVTSLVLAMATNDFVATNGRGCVKTKRSAGLAGKARCQCK